MKPTVWKNLPMLSKKLFFRLEIGCLRLVKDRSDLHFKQKTFLLLRHCGKVTRTKNLQKNMKKFLVTEEIKLQAGGEVTLTVHIDEEEYRNAMWDFIRSETEGTWT